MASFSAFLHVLREQYALRDSCTGLEQPIHWRTGFPRGKATGSPMVLELVVPEGAALDKLVAYAAANTRTEDGYIGYQRPDLAGTDHCWWFRRAYCVGLLVAFNSLGRDGQPALRLWVALSASEQGYARGSGAPFVLPTSKEYEYKPAQAAAQTHKPAPVPVLPPGAFRKSEADPVQALLGPGRLSHPEEWNATLAMLKQEGVEVSYRSGAMGYWAVAGEPGRMLLDPDMSIAALRHETRHFLDDKKLGFPGMGYFFLNLEERWKFEFNAYIEEINLMRSLREFDTGQKLVRLARQEKRLIFNPAF